MLELHPQDWCGSWGNWAYPLETLPCMSGNVEPWAAVPPLALADSPSVHTVEGMVVADRAVVGTAAAHTAVDMAEAVCIVPFVHRLFVEQECLWS